MRYWTDSQILDALRDWDERYGHQPTFGELKAGTQGRYPSAETVQRHFGTFANALVAAGFEAPQQGAARREVQRRRDEETARLAARFDGGATYTELARELGVSPQALGRRIRRWRAIYGVESRPIRPGRLPSRGTRRAVLYTARHARTDLDNGRSGVVL